MIDCRWFPFNSSLAVQRCLCCQRHLKVPVRAEHDDHDDHDHEEYDDHDHEEDGVGDDNEHLLTSAVSQIQ